MKHTIRWILVLVAACAIGSAVTYPIAHHRGYEGGYRKGFNSGLREGEFGNALGLFEALRLLRSGDLPRTTQFMETTCFAVAHSYYRDPIPSPGEAGDWEGAPRSDQWPNLSAARAVAKGLSVYRATYRTNSAAWDGNERVLDAQLAKIKSDDEKAWSSIVVEPTDTAPRGS